MLTPQLHRQWFILNITHNRIDWFEFGPINDLDHSLSFYGNGNWSRIYCQ